MPANTASQQNSLIGPDHPLENEGPLKRDVIAGLEKGLQVIEAFDQERTRLTISEVAQHTGLTRAAARRRSARSPPSCTAPRPASASGSTCRPSPR